jgi:peptidoglycan/LPS O-acetylase OafA/YrhL
MTGFALARRCGPDHALVAPSSAEEVQVMSRVNVPLSNLRGLVILIVVAFHSVLPYLASQPPQPFPFDAAPYRWLAFPIIDSERFFGFDLFCAWQDVSLMSLMFMLAGLFTATSLDRKGARAYLSDRWLRIGVPFLLATAILSPLAYYASYRTTAADPSLAAFWQHWQDLPMWPSGPAWFLWQLFAFSALAAALHSLAPQWLKTLSDHAARLDDRPLACFGMLTALSTLAYAPLALGFSAWDWTWFGPFSFQISRPLIYLVYFFAGVAVGSLDDSRLLNSEGPLARHWLAWLAAAFASFAGWGLLTSLTLPDWNAAPLLYRFAAALAYPPACATGILCLLAICLRLLQGRDRLLDSLSANAYSIYLLHYVFVVWLQYALLGEALGAISKGVIVFAGALALSWSASAGLAALLRQAGAPRKGAIADQPR